jgi:Winged helix-turn helix
MRFPRSTLYRWVNRVKKEGKDGLQGYSKRPKKLARQKVTEEVIGLIRSIREEFDFGPKELFTIKSRNNTTKIILIYEYLCRMKISEYNVVMQWKQ